MSVKGRLARPSDSSGVAARRVDLHRTLGYAGVALGVFMMVIGVYVAVIGAGCCSS